MKNKKVFWMAVVVILLLIATTAIFLLTKKEPTPVVNPTTAPTATTVPNVEPTLEPSVTEVPVETPAVEPTLEPTATTVPTPTESAEPVATVTPTEAPEHEHMWLRIETTATCVLDGSIEELCMCGAKQNVTVIPATGHTAERKVTKEATVEEEGTWEEVCTVCGEVVEKGTIEKLVPTATPSPTATPVPTPTPTVTPVPTVTPTATPKPTETPADVTPSPKPTATSTPVPTSTPTPMPTATPTPVPECEHKLTKLYMAEETETEEIYHQVCADCGELLNKMTLPKAVSPTPTPTNTPDKEADYGEIVDVYYDSSSSVKADVTVYADGTKVFVSGKDGAYVVITPDGLKTKDYTGTEKECKYGVDETILYKEYLEGFDLLAREYLYKMTKVREDLRSDKDWTISYYIYVYEDKVTDTTTAYLCNSDGSKNKYSEHVFADDPSLNSTRTGPINGESVLKELGFGYGAPGAVEYIILPAEFIYHDKENKEIHLYEY